MSMVAGLTSTQHQVLRVLAADTDALKVTDIAKHIDLHSNTVREVLASLQEMNLVSRRRAPLEGRGRPSWLYEATVTTDPEQIAQEFANFSAAVSQQIAETSPHPEATALALGRTWGKQILKDQQIPSHAHIDADTESRGQRFVVHAAKIRLFLSRLGFEAKPGESPAEIVLHQCPLINDNTSDPQLICQMHAGMLDHVVSTLSRDRLGTELLPFVGPGICQVNLVAGAKMSTSNDG